MPESGSKPQSTAIQFHGMEMVLTPAGFIYLPSERTVVVADLHLEKGSAFARRGTLLPPYDSQATLERLARELTRYNPQRVVSLGDGFHDTAGARLITGAAADLMLELAGCHDWYWIKGNHDHELPSALPGTVLERLRLGTLSLQHEPDAQLDGVLAGHLHPKARITNRRRTMSRPCFAWSDRLMIMPAFGSFTGGLNVLDPAIADWLPRPSIGLLGEQRLYFVNCNHLVHEPGSLSHVHQLN